MELSHLFQPKDFVLGLDPVDKWEGIDTLLDHMVEVGRLDAAKLPELREAVLQRERSMSTGMERGIAIPHAAVDGLSDVIAVLGVVAREGGLAFESIDARPTQLVVLLLIPRAQKLLHIRTLADIARVLGRDSVRQALLTASTADEAWHALREGEGAHPG